MKPQIISLLFYKKDNSLNKTTKPNSLNSYTVCHSFTYVMLHEFAVVFLEPEVSQLLRNVAVGIDESVVASRTLRLFYRVDQLHHVLSFVFFLVLYFVLVAVDIRSTFAYEYRGKILMAKWFYKL